MTIQLNGEEKAFPDHQKMTVAGLVEQLDLGPQPVLVELDGEALYEREFADKEVSDGSRVEIIRMVAGG